MQATFGTEHTEEVFVPETDFVPQKTDSFRRYLAQVAVNPNTRQGNE